MDFEDDKRDIRFLVTDWDIEKKKKFIKKAKNVSEENRVNIGKDLALDNMLQIKFLFNKAFKNFVFHDIYNNPSKRRVVFKELIKLIPDYIRVDDEIEKYTSKQQINYEITVNDDIKTAKNKLTNNYKEVNEYLIEKWEHLMNKRDLDGAQAVLNCMLLNERDHFYFDNLYLDDSPYSGLVHPHKFQFLVESFTVSKVKNYRLYCDEDPRCFKFLKELSHLFSDEVINKLTILVYETFEVERTEINISYYSVLIERLLRIIPDIYFRTLNMEQKLKLLNENFDLQTLLRLFIQDDTNITFAKWLNFVKFLIDQRFYHEAFELVEWYTESRFKNIKDMHKYYYFDILGETNFHNRNFEEALKNFEEALNYIEFITDYSFGGNDSKDSIKSTSKWYKANCLVKLAKTFGHLRKTNDFYNCINNLKELVKNIENPDEKFYIYLQLSLVFKELSYFDKEKVCLNNALNLQVQSNKLEIVNYIEFRIRCYDQTMMNLAKLGIIEIEQIIEIVLRNASLMLKCFNFRDAKEMWENLLPEVEKLPQGECKDYKLIINKNLGYVNLFLGDYQDAFKYFGEASLFDKDPEAKLYLIILQILQDNDSQAIELIKEISYIFELNNRFNSKALMFWILDLMNFIGEKKLTTITKALQKEEFNYKYEFFYKLGDKIAGSGFFATSINLIDFALRNTDNEQLRALCFKVRGNIYAFQDKHQLAIQEYHKAIEKDEDLIEAYKNMALCYKNIFDYINASKSIDTAIQIAKKKKFHHDDLLDYKLKIETLFMDKLNFSKIKSQKARDALKSAEQIFFDYHTRKDLPDGFAVPVGYAKALEIILDEEFSSLFKPLLSEYQQRYFKKKLSYDFHVKFGNLFRNKSIMLGSWQIILKTTLYQNLNNLDREVQKFIKVLKNNFTNNTIETVINAINYIRSVRNSLSHTEVISIVKIKDIRKKVINYLNHIIDLLY